MHPELPYLAAGGVALVGGIARHKAFPPNALPAVAATIALTVVASATAGSRVAPLVRAIGILLLFAAAMGAVRAISDSRKAK